VQAVDTQAAARRWAQTWERAWATKDAEAIAALYAPGAIYRSHPMRDPEPGGAFAYTQREFALEDSIECRFGTPVAAGGRASVEWWASYVEDGRELTLAGATVLQFDAEGLVVDHLDYWSKPTAEDPRSRAGEDHEATRRTTAERLSKSLEDRFAQMCCPDVPSTSLVSLRLSRSSRLTPHDEDQRGDQQPQHRGAVGDVDGIGAGA